jgi:beta-hydroxyacyl-ACP dehydratase FabZ
VSGEAKRYDIEWVLSILPHRYPFLMVDAVSEIEPGRRIVALKSVTVNEPFFQGHFPEHPVMPGVLLIEGMAQAAALLLMHEMSEEERRRKLFYFASIDKAFFRRPVVPGDQVRYEIEVVRRRTRFCRLSGKALVGDEIAAEGICSSALVDR